MKEEDLVKTQTDKQVNVAQIDKTEDKKNVNNKVTIQQSTTQQSQNTNDNNKKENSNTQNKVTTTDKNNIKNQATNNTENNNKNTNTNNVITNTTAQNNNISNTTSNNNSAVGNNNKNASNTTNNNTNKNTNTNTSVNTNTIETPKQDEKKFVRNSEYINKMKNYLTANSKREITIVEDASIINLTNGFTYSEFNLSAYTNKTGIVKIYARDYYVNGQYMYTQCYVL